MQTGENEQALRKILDLTRMLSITILIIHFYYFCYGLFNNFGISSLITDRILENIVKTNLFEKFSASKLIALLLMAISLIGIKGKKDHRMPVKKPLLFIFAGTLFYFGSVVVWQLNLPGNALASLYISVTSIGYVLLLSGGTYVSRIIKIKLNDDVFNSDNETFPQEERLLQNEYSVNLPAQYKLKTKTRKSWINIINPFRGLLVMGSPGSGKSYFVIQHIIQQHIRKGFCMFVYDFKFDDLTRIAYNEYLLNKHQYEIEPQFYFINFDDLRRSHRCNPLDAATMVDITDAAESSRTLMLGLNKEWIKKQGDFFVESPINFITALIWFLCKYDRERFCSLPHVIELAQIDYEKLFSILRTESHIEVLINPFVSAYLNEAREQLEGQIASAKISLSRLSSPQLYYILSGNDFSLDINNPFHPKFVCMGNNPQKTQTYGAVISLYTTALTRLINKRDRAKSSLVFDEFPTIYFNGIDNLIATARSNKVATTLAVQDASQLKLHYGKDQADVIINIVGNIISGQVSGDTAKQLSEKFGKILQDRQSMSVNRTDTSVTYSKQLDMAIPQSKIASLSSSEFVGMVADNPDEIIVHKTFCSRIQNDHSKLAEEQKSYKPLPTVNINADDQTVQSNFLRIKKEIADLVEKELGRMMDTPELMSLIIRR